jgi:hypothetical protein
MDTKNAAMQELQKKYAGCNLLMPAFSEVQMNPFYKITVMEVTADTSEHSGDIFKVGAIKSGKDSRGNDNWIDTFSPTKPLLMKIAAAAGIQFDPNHTYGIRVSENIYKAKALGALMMPDGNGKNHPDEKEICLNDEEANYRIDFERKAIKGITDTKQAKDAAELYKGKWIETTNKWGKPCQAYLIDECDHQKYIDRSVLINMSLLRKNMAAKAMTGAHLRVIRALTGIKSQYTLDELKKPFALPRVSFSPDYSDPEVKKIMFLHGMNSVGALFGTAPALPVINSMPPSPSADMFGSSIFADSTEYSNEDMEADLGISHDEPESQETPTYHEANSDPQPMSQQQSDSAKEYHCSKCGIAIQQNVYDYSCNRMGKPLCIKCQRTEK